ncbi:MAG TPA: Calx-beta domain-containing protein, partial [Hymenobacter sp.]|nr:Calx-beta domain-containing protein [Hymenobacter sp.]
MNQQLRKAIRTWIWLMMLSIAPVAWAQVSFTAGSLTATQNLNTLPTSSSATFTQNSTIVGIYAERTGNGTTVVPNNGSSNAGNLYSYGTGTNEDRALGSVGSSNAAAGNFTYGYRLKNETGSTITSLRIQYAGEQSRNSAAAAQTITFAYLISSAAITTTTPATALPAGYTAVAALDFTSPITGGTAGALDGNAAANRSIMDAAIDVSIPDGSEIMLRFYDPDHTGADHGLGIDDLSVTAMTAGPAVPTLTIVAQDAAAAEAGSDPGTFRITRTGATTGSLAVNYTIGGTASTADYSPGLSGTVTISDGAAFVDVLITPVNDVDPEGNETVTLTLTSSAGYTVGSPSAATVTISDDDAPAVPTVSITATDATGAEAGSDPVTFRITRTGSTTDPLSVSYTVGGTATNGTDYTPTMAGTATIAAGQPSVDITLAPTDDSEVEGNE